MSVRLLSRKEGLYRFYLLQWLYQLTFLLAVHISTNTKIIQLSDFCHANSWEMIPHFSLLLVCIFLVTYMLEHLFMSLIQLYISLSLKLLSFTICLSGFQYLG